jgi:hypothetical protein
MEKSSIFPCPDKILFEKPPLFDFTDPWTKIELVRGMICFSCVFLVAPVKISSSLYSFVLQPFNYYFPEININNVTDTIEHCFS